VRFAQARHTFKCREIRDGRGRIAYEPVSL
jgi:hypothetical protein